VCCSTLGQNRELSSEEKFFVVKTIALFQEQWTKREQINLALDIENKISSIAFDTQYKKVYVKQDDKEIEQIVEESIIAENAIKHEQGDDELNRDERALLRKKVIFSQYTKGFWAPDSAMEFKQKQKDNPPILLEGEEEVEKYIPLVPEFWKEKC
tara:strand:- start:471 stop:935 length:465 start_codon:yes stop_codon:yes gene_type:complete